MLGALVGVLLVNVGDAAAGRALVFFVCGMHVILGPILALTEPKLWRNAVGEFVLPLLVIVVALVVLSGQRSVPAGFQPR